MGRSAAECVNSGFGAGALVAFAVKTRLKCGDDEDKRRGKKSQCQIVRKSAKDIYGSHYALPDRPE